MLTPSQQAEAPQCGGSAPSSGYVAPTLQTPSNCVDPASGMPYFSPDCVNENLRIQAANQALLDAANRAVFLKNCHDMIAAENVSRAARGVPLQVDDCDSRTFGQTLPGTTGGSYTPASTPSAPPVTAVAARGGSLSFGNLSGGSNSTFKVGDRWQISITGASPNTTVAVKGGQNGGSTTTVMGQTDASGSFSLSGTITAYQIGSWQETWSVGSATSGSFSFTVVAASGQSSSGGTKDSSGGYVSSSDVNKLTDSSGLDIAGYHIPWWALLAAGGGALFLFSGGRR